MIRLSITKKDKKTFGVLEDPRRANARLAMILEENILFSKNCKYHETKMQIGKNRKYQF
jgi:hypothetical protein